MAYQSTIESTAATAATLEEMFGGGLVSMPSSGAEIRKGRLIFRFCSSHGATDIVSAGFFRACGGQPLSSTGSWHPNMVTRHVNNVGLRVGDLVCNVESSAGANPGRVTWHCVTASSWGGSTSIFSSTAAWDCSVSAHAST